ncbi:hypothetical protein [Micromonospora cathayae]|uniref:Helix-turn-helix domain-containing protein n=1 Tax=Micromonospora cathayae TaxID=3028804 RepID=A0ABY7ZN34_9ACTN|nr:hypothetical protein [Micromonospora sp. HUAS 3]WDZ84394.1 hypothetical protein PVK37_28790 [Micromonospora sp. HUAS 3]
MARSSAQRTPTCPRCGGRLARDNSSGRCNPCQAAERDRLTTPPALPPSFWDHEPLRRAFRDRHLGLVIRAYRNHPYHGRRPLPQHVVARWLGITQAQLSRVEGGPPMVHLDRLTHWAQLLTIPAGHLWFKLPDTPGEPAADRAGVQVDPATGTEGSDPDCEGDTMKRRSLVIAAGLASLGVTEPFGPVLAAADSPPRIGAEHIDSVQSVIDGFERADAAMGGNELCTFAMTLHQRVSRWERDCAYDRQVGHALHSVLGELECWIGWFALDAERRPESRRYLHEAILRARLQDDPRLEVRAMATMALLVRPNHPQESLHCAEAARRMATGWATPKLATLLNLRAARASAALGDAGGFNREMANALRAFDRGTHENDPHYISFVTPIEVGGTEAQSQVDLGHPDRAASTYENLAANPDAAYRRNQVLCSVDRAKALLLQADVDTSSRLALEILPAVATLQSKRTTTRFAALRQDLQQQTTRSTAAREFVVAYDEAVRA